MMKKALIPFTLLLFTTFLACKKDETTPVIKAPIIYGYNLRDIDGSFMKQIGTPNIKTTSTSNPNVYFGFYPNPVEDIAFVYSNSDNPDELKKIWIKPARLDESVNDSYLNFNIENNFFKDEIVFEHEFTSKQETFDFSNTTKGYYRVYFKIGQDTLYDNLVLVH